MDYPFPSAVVLAALPGSPFSGVFPPDNHHGQRLFAWHLIREEKEKKKRQLI